VFKPTPLQRKRILWVLASLLALTGLYALAGFYLAPYLIRAVALPRAAAALNAQLAAEAVEFDPFGLALSVRGFTIKDQAGKAMVALEELAIDLAGLDSLKQRQAVLEVRLAQPTVHLARGANGAFNLMALVPPDDGQPSAAPPFLLTRLSLAQGRVEYRDASGKQPFAATVEALSLSLDHLGTAPDQKGRFDLAGRLGGKQPWSVQGSLTLAPLAAEGRLEAQGIEPAAWIDSLAPADPWRLKSGKLDLKAEFHYGGKDQPALEIHGGEAGIEHLEAHGEAGQKLKLAKLSLRGIGYALDGQRLAVESAAAEQAATPWLDLAALKLEKLAYALGEQRLTLESIAAEGAASPDLKFARLSAAKLGYDLAGQRLELETAAAEGAITPWAKVAKLSARGLAYALAEQSFKLRAAELSEALADGGAEPPDPDLPAPASGPARGADQQRPRSQEIPRAVRIGALKLAEVSGSLRRRALDIGNLTTESGELGLRRTAQGLLKIRGLPDLALGGGDEGKQPAAAKSAEAPWSVTVGELRLSGYTLGFRDDSLEPPVRLHFSSASLRADDFTTEPGRLFRYSFATGLGWSGKVELDGQAQLSPLSSTLRFGVDKLWLRSLQPYWDRWVGFKLDRGLLNIWGDLVVRQAPELAVNYTGTADFVDLAAMDKRQGNDLFRWKSLKFDGIAVNTQPRRVSVRNVKADHSYTRVFIGQDGSLNLAHDLIPPAPPGAAKPAPKPAARAAQAPEWPVAIGVVQVADASMEFTDQTLTPNFNTQIENLEGSVRGISLEEKAKAVMYLEGRIDRISPVKIYGQANPARIGDQTDIAMEFRGVNLTSLSPYSSKFAGYRIEKGKLNLDLHYTLKDRRLEVSNRVVLDQLTLGERVDSPSATTLPLDLALALLKDSDGRIDIDLPISGNLDDPSFSLGSLYATAASHLITKLVGSPFSLLSGLVRDGGEDLGYVSFKPGDTALAADAKGKLAQVADALKQRPSLNLDIKGTADPTQDRTALAEAALLRRLRLDRVTELRAQGQRVPRSQADQLQLTDEDYRRLFTRYYRLSHPPAGAGLDGAAFDQAKREVLEKWPVSEMELRLLARARGQRVRDYLVDEAGLPDDRIYLLDVKLDPPGDKDIKALLSLSGS
jgi:uncharacterized protein involved in outer membrane biogenesis